MLSDGDQLRSGKEENISAQPMLFGWVVTGQWRTGYAQSLRKKHAEYNSYKLVSTRYIDWYLGLGDSNWHSYLLVQTENLPPSINAVSLLPVSVARPLPRGRFAGYKLALLQWDSCPFWALQIPSASVIPAASWLQSLSSPWPYTSAGRCVPNWMAPPPP